jgi:BirA family transcriptional regulator, biotin operon repressor / biotin---[acetyl-CoA-carboxylase] ligase
MPASVPSQSTSSRATAKVAGWSLHSFDTLTSTNIHARTLPAWHAVRAATQTRGYGRTGRHWVSDEGGLWLSAVLPTPGPAKFWSILPLAVGWAVIEVLGRLGVQQLHLRWPNDLMLGRRKLAGLLLERFSPATAVVGLGINVTNRPAAADPQLDGAVVTLADILPAPPTLDTLSAEILSALSDMHARLLRDGFAPIASDLNAHHLQPCNVELTLHGHHTPLRAHFYGIDECGRLRVSTAEGVKRVFAAHEVALLRELG